MKKLLTIQLLTLVAIGGSAMAGAVNLPAASGNDLLPVTLIVEQDGNVEETILDSRDWVDLQDGMETDDWVPNSWANGVQENWWSTIDYRNPPGDYFWYAGREDESDPDPENHTYGYYNDSYMTLTTPSLDFSTTATPIELTFDMYYSYEAPGGEPEGYDGWDAANVRVSVDGGPFVPISGTPAYDITSSYAFGYQFGEGTGIPGWAASSWAWQAASFDLSAYQGETDVRVRWASCADPAYDFTDAPLICFGLAIDDIVISDAREILWENDGDDAAPDAPISSYELGADYWIWTDADPNSGTYSINHDDQFYCGAWVPSPPVDLPADMTIFLSLMNYCDMPDSDGDDDGFLEDYWHVHISNDGGASWEELCYEYARDYNITDYGLMDAATIFNGTLDLTPYAGQTIQLAIEIQTDGNHDGGDGTGLWIDDVVILATDTPADDCGISRIWLDSPRSENLERGVGVEVTNYGMNDQFNVACYYSVEKDGVPVQGQTALAPFNNVTSLNSTRYYGTFAPFTPVDGPGVYTFTAWTEIIGDEDPENDSWTQDFTVLQDGTGLLIYDGDISSAWNLSADDWVFVRYDMDIGAPFNAQYFTALMYNMEIGDPVNVVVYDAGVDDEAPGELIAEVTYDVNAIYPDYDHYYIGDIPELQNRTTDFWVGVHGPCGVVGLNEIYWMQHTYYGYFEEEVWTVEPWGGDISMVVEGCWTDAGCFSYVDLHLDIVYVAGDALLEWDDATGADSYSVYRSTEPYFLLDETTLLADGVLVSQYTDAGASDKYFYRVVAVMVD